MTDIVELVKADLAKAGLKAPDINTYMSEFSPRAPAEPTPRVTPKFSVKVIKAK